MSHEVGVIKNMQVRLKKMHRTFSHGALVRAKDAKALAPRIAKAK